MERLTKDYSFKALSRDILVVSVVTRDSQNSIIDWAAYVGTVPGKRHVVEFMDVARTGTKVSKEMGVLLFPNLDSDRWRS